MDLWYSSDNTISENIISQNHDNGVYIEFSSFNNNINLNCFTNNTLNAYDDGSNNHWDNGTMGNYWDDYTGLDADGDGIGDISYNITGYAGSQDNFPLMECPISTQDGGGIPGYNLFFLLGILSIVAIFKSKKLKKT